MKRVFILVKIAWLHFLIDTYKTALSKNGKLTGEVGIRGYLGLLLNLIFPWRRTPQGVLAHRQAFVEKRTKKLNDLKAENERLKRNKGS
jgi:hypothetical protein